MSNRKFKRDKFNKIELFFNVYDSILIVAVTLLFMFILFGFLDK